jgi:hypothetical protein
MSVESRLTDSDTVGMDCAGICLREKLDEVCLRCFLQCSDRARLKTNPRFDLFGDRPHQALERQLANEDLRRFLILADFPKGHGS